MRILLDECVPRRLKGHFPGHVVIEFTFEARQLYPRPFIARLISWRAIHLLACGTDPDLPDGFVVPFSRTASYFDMKFGEAFYAQAVNAGGFPEETRSLAAAFVARVRRAGEVRTDRWS